MDDCFRLVEDNQTAVELIQGLRQECEHGGFNFTKEVRDLDLGHESLLIERALGVQWCVQSDIFEFRIVFNDKPPTRRGILSIVSSIYDPLGFAAPPTLLAKKILQELCRKEIG